MQLDERRVVAFEALARGPEGPLHRPDALFAAAAQAGRLAELEAACQEAAVVGARRARLRMPLFVNLEPQLVEAGSLRGLARIAAIRGDEGPIVLEVTERALTARPAELLAFLAQARRLGFGIALDDVGVDPRSLALLPVVRPDVVKLDRRLVQAPADPDVAGIVTAIAAECERTGALVLAEGIETEAHRRTARSAGAHLGQGWLFGRPGPAPAGAETAWRPPRVPELPAIAAGATPFDVVAPEREVRVADWSFLLRISHVLEAQGRALGEEALVVSAFQSADRFTPLTAERYAALAARAALVVALGVGMPAEPAPGVRGALLRPEDRLRGEWSVVVLGPHFSGALVARERSEPRRFDYAVTYRRGHVVRAAATLMGRVLPANVDPERQEPAGLRRIALP